jgi:hypothetical protein
LTAPVSKGVVHHPTGVLVEYLRTCASISTCLCNGIADLLDEDGTTALQLRLERRDTRNIPSKENVERDLIAYWCVQELTEARVTDALCHDILARLLAAQPGWELKHGREYWLERNDVTEIRLRHGQRISKNIAIKIAAFQINKSFQAVKKMIAGIEAVQREG